MSSFVLLIHSYPSVFLIYLAKKSGNFGSASQLAKQLVQETLLDEGLKVVKEFTSDRSRTPVEATTAGTDESRTSMTGSLSNPSSSAEPSPIKSDPLTSIMGNRLQSPQILSHFMSQQHHVPRPRGRPPKSQVIADRLEAAYQEKLTQHIQQTFLASQYNQMLGQSLAAAAAANGYSNPMSSNGHASGMEPIIGSHEKETHENNGHGKGQYGPFESSGDSSPKDMVMRTTKNGDSVNGSDMELISDLSVKQEQLSNGRDCGGIIESTDS
jgi:hypothetical protein